ncbi:alcohol dehydrogenase catalytic domain-containing protein [Nonomuraea sp. NEAU-A123]|uniref:alcohol dehydrogenase catalytic domain-containing protein n=1 Tax=Nonomuraea sp. NEAU-A123 TaxID=2839649 RepID=UPI002032E0BE|nr:alcohol dehydrogenase catalytic domain-containing protein [Nonomuraea sp. NEAU-A123]
MKALVYNGARDVVVKDVPDARIERPTDVLVHVTTTNICGSDLHMYEGRTDLVPGRVLGHENLGEVVEVGSAVDRIKVGDMVCIPFNISCGHCKNCETGLTAFCLTLNPDAAGAAYGFAGMGPYDGGQAELLRVPYGDFNCLRRHRRSRHLPAPGPRRPRRDGQEGRDPLRHGPVLVQGPEDRHRSGQRQSLQSAAAQPYPRRSRHAVVRRLTRVAA